MQQSEIFTALLRQGQRHTAPQTTRGEQISWKICRRLAVIILTVADEWGGMW